MLGLVLLSLTHILPGHVITAVNTVNAALLLSCATPRLARGQTALLALDPRCRHHLRKTFNLTQRC